MKKLAMISTDIFFFSTITVAILLFYKSFSPDLSDKLSGDYSSGAGLLALVGAALRSSVRRVLKEKTQAKK
jgi:hypothetical protein